MGKLNVEPIPTHTGSMLWVTGGAVYGEPAKGTHVFVSERYSSLIVITGSNGFGAHVPGVFTFIKKRFAVKCQAGNRRTIDAMDVKSSCHAIG